MHVVMQTTMHVRCSKIISRLSTKDKTKGSRPSTKDKTKGVVGIANFADNAMQKRGVIRRLIFSAQNVHTRQSVLGLRQIPDTNRKLFALLVLLHCLVLNDIDLDTDINNDINKDNECKQQTQTTKSKLTL